MISPELSSIATVLEDLTRRITAAAEEAAATDDEAVAQCLFEVERSLQGTLRRLGALR